MLSWENVGKFKILDVVFTGKHSLKSNGFTEKVQHQSSNIKDLGLHIEVCVHPNMNGFTKSI